MTFNNYTIHHLDLSTDILPITGVSGEAHYFVFWYKRVPLGQCFLTSSQVTTPDIFIAECFKAILPALNHYGHATQPQAPKSFQEAMDLCEKVTRPFNELATPATSDVSVVICTRNRPETLRNCLTALHLQRCKPLEILVVDNASSTDDTRKAALEFPFVRYVPENNVGLDIARNTGARHAHGSIIAYTDDDTEPDPDWVYRVWETFEKNDIVAMTGLVIAGSLQTEAEVIFEKYWPFNRGFVRKIYDRRFFNATLPEGPPVWEIGAGANMAFRKAVFEDVGYFDARLDVGAAGCSGDSELWYRILANGYRVFYNPMAVVKHFHRTSLPALKRQLYSYMKGFTVAMLIQYQRFGHRGNLQHLFRTIPLYYLGRLKRGFPKYNFQNQTLFEEMRGVLAGMLYFLRHRKTDPEIYYGNDRF
jgi:GT2 family glycosyltransferase